MRRRVLYLSSVGGHDFRFIEQLKAVEDEWETLFCTFKPPLIDEIATYGVAAENLNPEERPFDDFDRAGAYGPIDRWRLRRHFAAHIASFERIVERFKPDVVHSGWLQTDSYVAAKGKRVPTLMAEWGSDIFLRPHDNRRNYAKTLWTLQQADMILCDCKAAEDKIGAMLAPTKTPMIIFPWEIDRKLFNTAGRSMDKPERLRFIVVKNLVEVSSLHTMVEAFASLQRPFSVDVYGQGKLRQALEAQCDAAGLTDKIIFHGQIDNRKLPDVLRQHDIFVSCNLSEGTSLALMEAMSCGVLPVATEIPAYQEWIGQWQKWLLGYRAVMRRRCSRCCSG